MSSRSVTMSMVQRLLLGGASVGSWVGGAAATFVSDNGAGAAALVAAGAATGVVSLMGRWPTKLTFSGSEFAWDEVHEAVDEQIAAAEESDEAAPVLEELRTLSARLRALETTGVAPLPPAELYDQQVEAALRRILPEARIERQGVRDRQVADFLVRHRGRHLFVETKWRRDAERPFRGGTLSQLLSHLDPNQRLLVVVNAGDVGAARRLLSDALPRGVVVGWRDERDDEELERAVREVLG